MDRDVSTKQSRARVSRYRTRGVAEGSRRVEVTVPAGDANLLRTIAGALRSGGVNARYIREALQPMLSASKAMTGPELVAFFRTSPLVEADLQIERDTSTGRSVEFD